MAEETMTLTVSVTVPVEVYNRASSGVCTSIGVVCSANPGGVRTVSSEESM